MWLAILSLCISAIIAIELIIHIVQWKTVGDFTYFICRPFCIEMSMFTGFIIRVLLVALCGAGLYYGISYWF